MMPRAPLSTLFPYTTLFRSGCARRGTGRPPPRPRRPARLRSGGRHGGMAEGVRAAPPARPAEPFLPPPGRVDRKSTRLNSSHLGISYAVFCLKKKTTRQLNEGQEHERDAEQHERQQRCNFAGSLAMRQLEWTTRRGDNAKQDRNRLRMRGDPD